MVRRIDAPGQTDLALAAEEVGAPVISLADIESLCGRLKGQGWMTASELAALLGGWSDRKVRAVARAATPGVVSYPGSPGYKLWEECSVEEVDRCIDTFESQAKDMTQRAVIYKQAYHSRFRGTSS